MSISRYTLLVGAQLIVNVTLALWLYNEYLHNPFMQAYMSSVWSVIWPEVTVAAGILVGVAGSLAAYSRGHLRRLIKVPPQGVAQATRLFEEYASKIAAGAASENEVDKNLWEDIHNDSFGNEKITFARDDGFYHCRRSDLELMESSALMSIFESSKKFLDFDMYKPYLNTKPPVGYDPMALQRQVKRAIELIQEILNQRFKKESEQE